jgi:phosphate starvation-inducible PhoH-like protein
MPRRNKNVQPQRSKQQQQQQQQQQPRRNARPGNKDKRGYHDSYSQLENAGAFYEEAAPVAVKSQPLRALNEAQFNAIAAIHANDITFLVGPAGTGKSYIMASIACEMLLNKEIERIIISRPKRTVDNEDWGALPGEIEDKFAVFLEPFKDTLVKKLGVTHYEYLVKRKRIEAKPLAFLRGTTFTDAMVLLDETQNVSVEQIRCFLTRVGEGVKICVAGDPDQSDIKFTQSGLDYAIERLDGIEGISVERFEEEDIVRSALAKKITIAFRK